MDKMKRGNMKLTLLVLCVLMLFVTPAFAGLVVDIPMNEQINLSDPHDPDFDAITGNDEFTDGASRMFLEYGYNFAIEVDLAKAGVGIVDLSGNDYYYKLSFTGRIYQDVVTNTNPYDDAPIFCYFEDAVGRQYGLGMMYQTGTGDDPYPTWTTLTKTLDFTVAGEWPYDPEFDATQVAKVSWYTTDWYTPQPPLSGNDFMDIKNLQIALVPIPAAVWLFGSGLIGFVAVRRRFGTKPNPS